MCPNLNGYHMDTATPQRAAMKCGNEGLRITLLGCPRRPPFSHIFAHLGVRMWARVVRAPPRLDSRLPLDATDGYAVLRF